MVFAFIFDSVGAGEWLVLLAVLLVVMGPKNLPSTLRKVGNYYAKFRRAADSFKRQLMDMDREFERSMDEPPASASYSQPEPAVYDQPPYETASYDNASTPDPAPTETPPTETPPPDMGATAEAKPETEVEKTDVPEQSHQES